eukprot:TRINITY_DN3517_c3_g1_i2.p1 TRINITY_DN3517_c3_g1~~TRINITY_DN3517_c3_g1_i2.p1  ORF type:complete len:149 (-),score=2.66 TRINITY_DN3517_c3_g1_i2:181-627(-)
MTYSIQEREDSRWMLSFKSFERERERESRDRDFGVAGGHMQQKIKHNKKGERQMFKTNDGTPLAADRLPSTKGGRRWKAYDTADAGDVGMLLVAGGVWRRDAQQTGLYLPVWQCGSLCRRGRGDGREKAMQSEYRTHRQHTHPPPRIT